MLIKNNYDGASIEIIKYDDNKNEAYLSLKKEGDLYSYYYNFYLKNTNKVGFIYITNLKNTLYYVKGKNPVPYIKENDNGWKKLDNSQIKIIDENNICIEIEPNVEGEISLFPRYNESDLEKFLEKISNNKYVKIQKDTLNKITIGNLDLPTFIIIGRQHPGETLSSFFIEGMISYILDNPEILEKNSFVFYPIVSINGVKNGNHRLTDGIDYNRSWGKENSPKEIKIIEEELGKYNIKLFIDVHGDEITKMDYIRTNNEEYTKIKIIQVIKDMSKLKRFLRALIKQRKIINFKNKTAREYVSETYKCSNMLIELSLSTNNDKNEKEKGYKFLKEVL